MKKLMLVVLFGVSGACSAQYVKAKDGKTNYKAGFSYYEPGRIEVKVTLLKWEKRGVEYQWRTKVECLGKTVLGGWTNDSWIDLYTDKAFLNAQTHQIVYYDEVDITLKINSSKK